MEYKEINKKLSRILTSLKEPDIVSCIRKPDDSGWIVNIEFLVTNRKYEVLTLDFHSEIDEETNLPMGPNPRRIGNFKKFTK